MHRERLLLDFFTEIAIVEHLVRKHMETLNHSDFTAAEFGLLNYFVRNQRERESKATLAWCFQVSIEEMEPVIAALEQRGLLGRIGQGDDQVIGITASGHSAHAEAVDKMAPEIAPLMSEFADDDLAKAVEVLRETRRTFDNLPERLAS
jgi:DNA-binding MarR family transcriptional regulator